MKKKLFWIVGLMFILGSQAAFADPGNGKGKPDPVYTQTYPQEPCGGC